MQKILNHRQKRQDEASLIGHQTGEQTKQVDCAAGSIYPFIPGVKPEDISDILLDEGLEIRRSWGQGRRC